MTTDSKLAKQTSLPRKQLFREPATKPITPLVGNGTLATQKPKKRKAKK